MNAIPGRIQAENYDNGGAGVAYYDTTSGNAGGAGRLTESVDVETVNGITNIGWIIDGEWTEYTVAVAAGGSYTANFRVGSWNADRKIAMTVDGAPGCTVNVPNTGSSTAFTTVSTPVSLSAGTHVIRLTYLGSGQNIDYFELLGGTTPTAPTAVITAAPTGQPGQTAYNGPHALPGRVQAEEYDNGGANVAYSDTTTANTGGAGRLTEGVDVETASGITNIGWINNNEWTEYTVTVATGGSYTANVRAASPGAGQKVALTVDGAPGCTLTVPNTGSYRTYATASAPLSLTAGTHVIRLTYLVGSFGQNVDYFEVLGGTTTPAVTATPTKVPTTVATPVPTTVATVTPTKVPTTVATAVPTTVAPTTSGTLDPAMSTAQASTKADTASTAGYARLAAMQAAHKAWAVPSQSGLVSGATNARTAGLKSDGVTDNTAALQSILTNLPAGGKLYFPAGTYRLNGPIRITKPVTLVGEAGTVLDCTRATQYVFTVNKGGSTTTGTTITGFVIEGPGVETNPAMIDAYNLQNFRVSYVKFHNVGYAAVRINTCTDATIENCVFDNVFQKGYGYGVCVTERCDRIVVRDNFFVTRGRHGVTTGTSQTSLPQADYARRVTVENNYFENMTDRAADTHAETVGPHVVRNNVFYMCYGGVGLRGGLFEVSDNVMIECIYGISAYDRNAKPAMRASWTSSILRNTILNIRGDGITMRYINARVQDNVITAAADVTGTIGVFVDDEEYLPAQLKIEGTIIDGFKDDMIIVSPGTGIAQTNNYRRVNGIFQSI